MVQFDAQTHGIVKRLQNARLSLLQKQPFYALLLLHLRFALDPTCKTAYTDGERIAFNRDYVLSLSDQELEFVLMHQVLHAALGHPFRCQSDYDQKAYDLACDIIVNSNILYSFGMRTKYITTKQHGEAIHLAPDGQEGYHYTLEQVYAMVCECLQHPKKKADDDGDGDSANDRDGDSKGKADGEGEGKIGEEPEEKGKGKGKGKGKRKGTAAEADAADGSEADPDEPTPEALEALVKALLRPRNYSEEVLAQAKKEENPARAPDDLSGALEDAVDDHSFWEGDEETGAQNDVWMQRLLDAGELAEGTGSGRGVVPKAAERLLEALKHPTLDWRTILQDFIQEDICDYSFSPPDRRMEESPFFLPDFNEKDEQVKNILFMIDTSGSMSKMQITQCYSEIYGGIQQFNGRLDGWLGFFDAVVVEPTPFTDEEEFKIVRPKGGGGTSFHVIFEYVEKHMAQDPPVSIVILTDGEAPYPPEEAAMGIPVLWIINNEEITPPWGKIARIPSPKEDNSPILGMF